MNAAMAGSTVVSDTETVVVDGGTAEEAVAPAEGIGGSEGLGTAGGASDGLGTGGTLSVRRGIGGAWVLGLDMGPGGWEAPREAMPSEGFGTAIWDRLSPPGLGTFGARPVCPAAFEAPPP